MDRLYDCYKDLKALVGENVESYESVALVNEYRKYWRPQKVRVVLLAESHVFTSDKDRACRVFPIPELPDYPDRYAKFVYCLAYGEERLTDRKADLGRDGTPQFWKILYSCINRPDSNRVFSPVLKSKTEFGQRIRNKIELLKTLRANGVWLLDASVMAVYDKGSKPPTNTIAKMLRLSWRHCIEPIITSEAPSHVIVIGKFVADTIKTNLEKTVGSKYTVIDQPNAHLSSEQHLANFQKYYEICSA